jgi:predicted RNA methylase
MLEDKVRMEKFRRALASLCKDKTVIDVGAGTGVLSLMAIDNGASQVFAIERSGIAKEAKRAFKMVPYKGRISLH